MSAMKDHLDKYISYNSETGIFTRKTSYNSFMAGDQTGAIDNKGYIILSVKRKRVKAHRAAMIMTYGSAPKITDHINGVKSDNRIINLRGVTARDNSRNTSKTKRNTSGRVGVHWNKMEKKWAVKIANDNNYNLHIGYFKCKLDAVAARIRAEKKYGYHENHGRAKP